MRTLATLVSGILLAACGGEQQASQTSKSPMASMNSTPLVLGLTERQLLDADLVDANGNELGDVEALVRGPDGAVRQLLVEIEDSSPDRYVHVPVSGLQPVGRGDDKDVQTTLTREQLVAMPEVRR